MRNLALTQAYNPRVSPLLRGTKEKILIPPLSKGGLGGVKSQTAKQQSLSTFYLIVNTALIAAVSILETSPIARKVRLQITKPKTGTENRLLPKQTDSLVQMHPQVQSYPCLKQPPQSVRFWR